MIIIMSDLQNSDHTTPLNHKEETDVSELSDKPQIGLTKYRFVIVIVYCSLNFANAMHWVTFSSCAENFGKLYNLNKFQVDLFSMIYMIIYPFVCVPQAYIIDNKSTRLGLSLAAILTIAGAGIKLLIGQSIYFAYIGQFIIASFQPAILNSPAKIASTWFDEKTRVLVTSICCAANTIGILFGFLVHGFVFDDSEISKHNFFIYLLVEFGITVGLSTPLLIFFRSKPKLPPSLSQNKYVSPPLKESLKLLIKNRNFLKLLGSTTCAIGFINIFGTIVNSYLRMYNISDEIITYIAATANLSGIIASLLVSIILDKIKKYQRILIVLNVASIVFMILVTSLLEILNKNNAVYIAFVFYTLTVSSIVPIFTTSMDYVCELTYPVGESISEGLIMSCNQISGIIGILICDSFMEYLPQYRFLTNVFIIFLVLISLINIVFIREELHRNKKDIGEESESNDEIHKIETEKSNEVRDSNGNGHQIKNEDDTNKEI